MWKAEAWAWGRPFSAVVGGSPPPAGPVLGVVDGVLPQVGPRLGPALLVDGFPALEGPRDRGGQDPAALLLHVEELRVGPPRRHAAVVDRRELRLCASTQG